MTAGNDSAWRTREKGTEVTRLPSPFACAGGMSEKGKAKNTEKRELRTGAKA
jgi:hypothetical protein